VLILTADVGEGHIAAGRAISEGLEELGIRPTVCDGLAALGRLPRHVIRNGYRFQLRVAPATYSATYWIGAHVAPVRTLGAWALGQVGRRGLRRLVRRHRPDVIVSTHPAITCVLGRMRLRRQLAVPVCATITDLADFAFWSHPGTDLHLVTHPRAIERVERFAGGGSAAHVGPIVSRRFLEIREPGEARRALGLPRDGRLIVVSGGGWGVGDLDGATHEALAAGATDVIVVAGRNEIAQAALTRRFAGDPRVRVWGFTDRMPDLLRAADAIVHSTGGMTSFEAIACGCPVIAYGSTLGHIRVHNRALAELGLAVVADTREELRDALAARVRAPRRRQPVLQSCRDAPALVASLRARVRPFARWRIAAGRGAAVLSCVVALFAGMATDEAYSLAERPLDLRPGTSLQTSQRAVGLIVRVPSGDPRALAAALAARDVHASFALRTPAMASTTRTLATLGDDSLPELGGGPASWLRTHRELRDAVVVSTWRLYLASPSELGLDQYMLAASMHGRPIAGKVTIGTRAQALPTLSPGDLVVVTASGPVASSATRIVALAGRLAARALSAESLSELASSSPTTERTAGDVMSTAAEQSTASSPMMMPHGPSAA
jgi:processive 1,2-diacylglycerol beta-glucosyltransferase